jgi:hypothetical protein
MSDTKLYWKPAPTRLTALQRRDLRRQYAQICVRAVADAFEQVIRLATKENPQGNTYAVMADFGAAMRAVVAELAPGGKYEEPLAEKHAGRQGEELVGRSEVQS